MNQARARPRNNPLPPTSRKLRPASHTEKAPLTTAATATRKATRPVPSLTRLSPPTTVPTRSGTPNLPKIASAATGSVGDRKSTRLNSSHVAISYAVFCLKKKKRKTLPPLAHRHRTNQIEYRRHRRPLMRRRVGIGGIVFAFFFFNDTATTEIYTLSLHDALPIRKRRAHRSSGRRLPAPPPTRIARRPPGDRKSTRLNSSHVAISYAVFCLKKKKKTKLHPLPKKTNNTNNTQDQ